jgi:cyclopropane fatty-acyl-phospholipid synthase-like methyltransferase
VIACDFDEQAIRTAKTKNAAPNVEFILADIRHAMPAGSFDQIIWDAAIEHFTLEETRSILTDIKLRLANRGILSGYTIVEKNADEKHLSHHEYEFKDKQDLMAILSPFFQRVKIFETMYPTRHNLYFWASDSSLPFDAEWEFTLSK